MGFQLTLESCNTCAIVYDRRLSGNEFHSVGVVKLIDRLPIDDRISGIVRRLVPEERRLRDG